MYPNKNSNNRKIESARGMMGEGKRRESLFYLSTSHRALRATKRPLRRRGLQVDAPITGGRAYKRTFTVTLQRSSKQMLKMVVTRAQLTSKTFSTF